MKLTTILSLFTVLTLSACKDKGGADSGTSETGETGETDTPAGLAIAGSYTDNWGGTHEITDGSWVQGSSTYHITQFDNDAMFAIAHNDSGNEYNPDLFSRFDWATDGSGQLWYCQTAYAAADEAEALATAAADPTDPATTGCGGFSWTQLISAG